MEADPPPTPELSSPREGNQPDPRTCRTTIRAILGAVDAHDKKRVVVGGTVRSGRKPSSLLAFLELNDGSCQLNLRAVVKAEVYKLRRLTPAGTPVLLEGVLEKLDGAKHKQLIELKVEKVIEVGEVDAKAYPLSKTRLTLGLTDLVHLRPRTDKLPWIVLCGGGLIAPPDDHVEYPASIPDNASCMASTNDWLLLGICQQTPEHGPYCFDNYVLHNPFCLEYIPLPELDAALHRTYNIRKFLMRSTIHDFIVVITTDKNTPLIVILPGKGVWLPKPRATPYIYIVDIAFLGDKLYGITKAENLIPFDLGLDEDGSPVVTIGRRVIRQPLDYEGYEWWSASDDDNNDLDDDDDDDSDLDDEDDNDEDEEEDDDGGGEEEEQDEVDDHEESVTDDEDVGKYINYLSRSHVFIPDDKIITWHLVESRMKLLMVKSHMHMDPKVLIPSIRRVEVFVADIDRGEWVLAHGLDGQALFIGLGFSKSVYAPFGDVAEGDIYFIETGEVFNMKTQFSNLKRFRKPFYYGTSGNWLFPPELALSQ
uniref:Uncharacterized protein n=1 Tax=Avena sativa TaxID=4498 RepID=A0ACD6A2Y5_AVESA